MKEFAPEYEVEPDTGWYRFPSDASYRKELFPQFSREEHPAKANVYLVQACVEYVSEVGDTVMDIMAGTGTIMTAALIGRQVVMIEIETKFQKLIERHMSDLERYEPGIVTAMNLLPGDCSKILPLPGLADHVVFSPPYAGIYKKKTLDKFSAETLGEGIMNYSESPDNVGNMNEFIYHQKMRRIYEGVFKTLPSGGTLTIIIKDHMNGGERVELCKRCWEDCIGLGFNGKDWFRWRPPGSAYLAVHRSHGLTVVDDESILILEKP